MVIFYSQNFTNEFKTGLRRGSLTYGGTEFLAEYWPLVEMGLFYWTHVLKWKKCTIKWYFPFEFIEIGHCDERLEFSEQLISSDTSFFLESP